MSVIGKACYSLHSKVKSNNGHVQKFMTFFNTQGWKEEQDANHIRLMDHVQ